VHKAKHRVAVHSWDMRVTSIGHAGFQIETTAGSIVCDPWFNPTFFGSWFPFPRVDTVDVAALRDARYLYVSHFHRDHLDPVALASHMSTEATVLLPEFGVDVLEAALVDVGFSKIVRTKSAKVVELDDGLRIAIASLAGPHIGPMGDSMLAVADPTATLLNQNDAHPADLDAAMPFGPPDIHLLQYSGAIWYPMVYEIPADEEAELISVKRARQTKRAIDYIEMADARFVVPSSGPPCFLDPEIFHLNDFSAVEPNAPETIFPDASQFLRELGAAGHDQGRLLIPGSTLDVGSNHDGRVTHPLPQAEVDSIFAEKRAYLTRYQTDTTAVRDAIVASWPTTESDLLTAIRDWFEPLLAIAHHTRRGVGGAVELATDDGAVRIIIDMENATVRPPHPNETPPFRFTTARPLLESSVARRVGDWCNELFLSCRFTAYRAGPYNEYLYTFFKSLSLERMTYAEAYYESQTADDEIDWVTVDGWVVEARCPHQRAKLDRVGSVCDGVLTCSLHGWQFDLETGACLNSEGAHIRVRGKVEHLDD